MRIAPGLMTSKLQLKHSTLQKHYRTRGNTEQSTLFVTMIGTGAIGPSYNSRARFEGVEDQDVQYQILWDTTFGVIKINATNFLCALRTH